MTARYERPISYAATWSRRTGLFAFLLFICGAVMHRLSMMSTPDFIAIAGLGVILAALAMLLAIFGFASLWKVGARGGKSSFFGFVMSAFVLAFFATVIWQSLSKPKLFEVTTDLIDVPDYVVPPAPSENWLGRREKADLAIREEQALAYPQVTGRRYNGAIDRVLAAVNLVADDQGYAIVAEDGVAGLLPDIEDLGAEDSGEPDTIEPLNGAIPIPVARPSEEIEPEIPGIRIARKQFASRSLVFGFRHDVVVRLIEEEETTFVDVRVQARYVPHDLGTSARVTRRFLSALDVALLGIVGG